DLSQELIRVAVAFIVQNYETWEPRFSVEANLEALQILIVHAEAHQSFYRNKQLKREVIRHERDEVKKMPSLVAQGAFFLLLEHYFRALTFWGVETDIPNTALAEAWGVAPTELLRRVSIWQADGGQVPDAFIEKGGKPCLSSSFLILGRYLWTPPLNADPQ